MTDRLLRVSVGALALAGIAVSAYLLQVRYAGGELRCTTGGCAIVQSSRYAGLLGLPVAALGLAAYLLIAATALSGARLARAAGASLARAAVGFSTYLVVVQVAVVDALCDWCLASDTITTLLAGLTLLRVREELRSPTANRSQPSSRSPADSA